VLAALHADPGASEPAVLGAAVTAALGPHIAAVMQQLPAHIIAAAHTSENDDFTRTAQDAAAVLADDIAGVRGGACTDSIGSVEAGCEGDSADGAAATSNSPAAGIPFTATCVAAREISLDSVTPENAIWRSVGDMLREGPGGPVRPAPLAAAGAGAFTADAPIYSREVGGALNEFAGNRELLAGAFPWVFMFGGAAAFAKEGSVPQHAMRHLFLQFHNGAAKDQQLLFLLANQTMRHACCRLTASRVVARPESIRAFYAIVNKSETQQLLAKAEGGVASEKEKDHLKKVLLPHLIIPGARIPNGPLARRACLQQLYSMLFFLGMPSVFWTLAPDDTHSSIACRLSFPSTSNAPGTFPADANAEGFIQAFAEGTVLKGVPGYAGVDIDLRSEALLRQVAANPIAACESFYGIANHVLSDLLKTPDHRHKKKSEPGARLMGLFGTPYGTFAVIEVQGRGALHIHLLHWGAYSPEVMQKAAADSTFCDRLRKAITFQFETQVPREEHIQRLRERAVDAGAPALAVSAPGAAGVPAAADPAPAGAAEPVAPAAGRAQARKPYPTEFPPVGADGKLNKQWLARVHWAVLRACVHRHTFTCRKPPTGHERCRVSMPCAFCEGYFAAGVAASDSALPTITEIRPTDFAPKFAVRPIFVPPICEPPLQAQPPPPLPQSASHMRSFARHPVPDRDRRCLVWETLRPLLDGRLSMKDLASISPLPGERSRDWLQRVLPVQNGLVSAFNAVAMGLIPCNQAAVMLGGVAQAKAALFYLVDYLTKDSNGINNIGTALLLAQEHNAAHPSTAEDTGTETRTALYLLQRTINNLTASMELAATQAAAIVLGHPAELCSHAFTKVFVTPATDFIKSSHEHRDTSADADPFADVPYDNLEVAGDGNAGESDDDWEDAECPAANLGLDEGQRRAAGVIAQEAAESRSSKRAHLEAVLNGSGPDANPALASVYTDIHGDRIAVQQHTHYAYRGQRLDHLNLTAYNMCVEIVPFKLARSGRRGAGAGAGAAADGDADVDALSEPEPEGADVLKRRSANFFSYFRKGHPLRLSHRQRLHTKVLLPQYIRSPPHIPAPSGRPDVHPRNECAAWQTRATVAAEYYLTSFKPWRARYAPAEHWDDDTPTDGALQAELKLTLVVREAHLDEDDVLPDLPVFVVASIPPPVSVPPQVPHPPKTGVVGDEDSQAPHFLLTWNAFGKFMQQLECGRKWVDSTARPRPVEFMPTPIERMWHGIIVGMAHGLSVSNGENAAQASYRTRKTKWWNRKRDMPDGTELPPGKPRSGARLDGGDDADDVDAETAQGHAADAALAKRMDAALKLLNRLASRATATDKRSAAHDAFIRHSLCAHASVLGTAALDAELDALGREDPGDSPVSSPGRAAEAGAAAVGANRAVFELVASSTKVLAVGAAVAETERAPSAPRTSGAGTAAVDNTPTSLPDVSDLTDEQLAGRSLLLDALDPSRASTAPRRILIHGGPGVGKTYFINHIIECCKVLGVRVICCALAAAAAINLPSGETLHSVGSIGRDRLLGKLPATKLQELRRRYNPASSVMGSRHPQSARVIVIDEISMVDPVLLSKLSQRLKLIMDCSLDFGGLHVIAMGDFLQIPPVGASCTLASAVLRQLPADQSMSSDYADGRRLFETIEMHSFTTQKRAQGPWAAVVASLRKERAITADLLKEIKPLTHAEVEADAEWQFSTVAVTGNEERAAISWAQLKRFARLHKLPIVAWHNPFFKEAFKGRLLTAEQRLELYLDPRFFCAFVPNAPGFINNQLSTIATSKGVCNGASCSMHSITFADGADPQRLADLRERIARARPGQVVWSELTPLSLNVTMSPPPRKKESDPLPPPLVFPDNETLVPGEAVVPLQMYKNVEAYNVSVADDDSVLRGEVSAEEFPFESAFCTTFHKLQGKTVTRLLVNLNVASQPPYLDFEFVYVALTRVRDGQHIRAMPPLPGQSLEHLLGFAADTDTKAWLDAFDPESRMFVRENARLEVWDARTKMWVTKAGREIPGKVVTKAKAKKIAAAALAAAAETAAAASAGGPATSAAAAAVAAAKKKAAFALTPAAIKAATLAATAAIVLANRTALRGLGISEQRAAELLTGHWQALAGLPINTVKPHSAFVTNDDLRSLRGCLGAEVIGHFCRLVASAKPDAFVVLDPLHTEYMTGGHAAAAYVAGVGKSPTRHLSDKLQRQHLIRDTVLIPAHLPGHWILLHVHHPTQTISVLDSLGSNPPSDAVRQLVARVNKWLQEERQQYPTLRPGMAADFSYEVEYSLAATLPRQADGVSCGAFVCAYAYWLVMHSAIPTTAHFNGQHHLAMRLAVLDASLTGRIRLPLPAPAGAAAGGAGAGAAGAADPAGLDNFAPMYDRPPRILHKKTTVVPVPRPMIAAAVAEDDAQLALVWNTQLQLYIQSVMVQSDMSAETVVIVVP